MWKDIFKSSEEFNRLPQKEQLAYLLSFGIRAPSTHNTQPWKFKIHNYSIDILPDLSKSLPFADATNRCLYISLGCCIENIAQAANYYGLASQVKLIESSKLPYMRIQFAQLINNNLSSGDIIQTIIKRRNSRGAYLKKRVNKKLINTIQTVIIPSKMIDIQVITDNNRKGIVTDLTVKGTLLASNLKEFRKEMSYWVIHNYSKRKDGMPGYSLNIPNIISFLLPFVIRKFSLGKITAKQIMENFSTSSALIIITSKKNDYESWMEVGRVGELAMLAFQSKGISTSISMAAIEMNLFNSMKVKELKLNGFPQFIFSIGYKKTTETRNSPRHKVSTKLL